MTKILGIQIQDRVAAAETVQDALTKNGCCIRTRLGLHEVGNTCAPAGLILLELAGDPKEWEKLESDLGALKGISVKSMEF